MAEIQTHQIDNCIPDSNVSRETLMVKRFFNQFWGDSYPEKLEKRLSDSLGLEVAITSSESGKGEMRIKLATSEQLDHVCKILGRTID